MRRNRTNFVNSILNDLHNTSRYLKEDYIFNDDEQGYGDDMQRGRGYDGDEYGEDDVRGPQQQMQQPQGDENAEQKAMHAHEIIQHEPIIQKIRQTAIDGLKKYAEDPTSSIYEFFKKVFLESDKVLTDDGSSSNGK